MPHRHSDLAACRAAPALLLAALLAGCPDDAPRPVRPYSTVPVLGDWLLSVTAEESSWGFYLYLPDDPEHPGAPHPLLVYLRGWGYFGWKPAPTLLRTGPLAPLRRTDFALDPAGRERLDPRVRRSLVVVPLLPHFDPAYDDPLGSYHPDTLHKVIEWVAARYPVDRTRIYLIGESDGGGGVWAFAARHPEEVAAAVPIACALRVPASEGMRHVPIWMFHDFHDDHIENSDPAFQAVTGTAQVLRGYPHAGGDPDEPAAADHTIRWAPGAGLGRWEPGVIPPGTGIGYTLYATGGHDAWTRTYASEAMWRWMYSQARRGL